MRSVSFCRDQVGCAGLVGNWGDWEGAAVPQQSGGGGFAPMHSLFCLPAAAPHH